MSTTTSRGAETTGATEESAVALPTFRYAVDVLPKPGILDPQGRAVEGSLGHLGIAGVSDVRVGRRVELSVTAPTEEQARATVERLAGELLANPLIEVHAIELLGAISTASRGTDGR
jgi:phosphoribosylformylglycinamidine synthase subunit PurS